MDWVFPGFIVLVIGVIVFLIGLYNRLVVLRNRVDNSWAQIDVQLKRRWDLIPRLVETVKGYMQHEASTLEAVIAARNFATNAHGVAEQGQAENQLAGALKSLFAVAEAYPDLKADVGFQKLQDELTGTEDKIAYARQFYNDSVMSFNTAIQSFPANMVAGMFGFVAREYFEIDETMAEPPAVDFSKTV